MANYQVYGNIPFFVEVKANNEYEAIDMAEEMNDEILAVINGKESEKVSVGDIQFDDYREIN